MVCTMTRTLLACLALCALAAPAAAADRVFPVADFDRVIVEGPYRVHLVVGRATRAVASGARDGLDRVSVEVRGQTLRVRASRGIWSGRPGIDPGPVTIALTTRMLRSARTIGPARLEIEGAAGLSVEFVVEGGGTIRAARVAAENLVLGLHGSGALELAGTARSLRGHFQGTGNVEATQLAAQGATITTNTLGNVALTVNGAAAITAYGLGGVIVAGRAACTLTGPGAAQVRCGAASDQRQDR
jgi:Putative auto-transporter adhesin, head GIN domain